MKCAITLVEIGRAAAEKKRKKVQAAIDQRRKDTIEWCDTYIEEKLLKNAMDGNEFPYCCILLKEESDRLNGVKYFTCFKKNAFSACEVIKEHICLEDLTAYLKINCYKIEFDRNSEEVIYTRTTDSYSTAIIGHWRISADPNCEKV